MPIPVNLRKIVQRRIRKDGGGVGLAADVNAAVAANVNEPGSSHTHVSTRQRIVQRSGETQVDETERIERRGA